MDAARTAETSGKIVVLTGFMGSGKTTVGRLLAGALGWSFVDLDDAVSARFGLPVPEIFAQHGEEVFRRGEAEALASVLQRQDVVIALGGGAPESEPVRSLLQLTPGCTVVYLEAPLQVLIERCESQSKDHRAVGRPLFDDPVSIALRHARRLPLYRSVANEVVPSGDTTSEVVADRIFRLLHIESVNFR